MPRPVYKFAFPVSNARLIYDRSKHICGKYVYSQEIIQNRLYPVTQGHIRLTLHTTQITI